MAEQHTQNTQNKPSAIILKFKPRRHHKSHHHGGAWKIAYADFVTAMMAFFLVMWLINSMTAEDKEGVASYFALANNPGEASGSQGILGGEIIRSEGVLQETAGNAPEQLTREKKNAATQGKEELTETQLKAAAEQARFEATEKIIRSHLEKEMHSLRDHVRMETTPQGLNIEILDAAGKSMFALGSSVLLPDMENVLRMVSQSIRDLPNPIKITGHTDATPYRRTDYDNWRLSSDRANAARGFLSPLVGVPKIQEVSGKADTALLRPDAPRDASNRRISIALLRQGDAEVDSKSQDPEPTTPSEGDRPLLFE